MKKRNHLKTFERAGELLQMGGESRLDWWKLRTSLHVAGERGLPKQMCYNKEVFAYLETK